MIAEAWAQSGGASGAAPSALIQMAPLLLVFVVFYFLLIRPQRKKEKDRQHLREEMLKSLKKSDHIVTIGGIHGVVALVGEDEVTIKVDEKADVRLRVSRDAISRVVGDEGETGDEKKLGEGGDAGR